MSGAHQWSKGRCAHCGAWEHDMNLSAVCDTSERDRAVTQLQQPMQHLAALAQPQPSPSAGEVLELLARYLEVNNRWAEIQDAPGYDSAADTQAEQDYINALRLLTDLDPAHLRALVTPPPAGALEE